MLWKSPAFSIIAIATLALGIGASTAIFSVVSSVLLSALPFPESDRLVRIVVTLQAGDQALQTSPGAADFHFLRNRSQLLERVAAQRFQDVTLVSQDSTERVIGIGVSDEWLETLGVQPLLGRGFDKREQAEGNSSGAVLISYRFWQRLFGGNSQAIGKTLRLNERSYTVIGVMPQQFRYPYKPDLWFPMTLSPTAVRPGDLNIVGRVKPGVSDSQLRQELDMIAVQLTREFSTKNGMGLVARRFEKEFQRDPNHSIVALIFAVAFVLAVSCVNLANLQLARGHARVREMAIRAAVGASRWRQIRLLLTESVVLAVLGGLGSVVLMLWATNWLAMLIAPRIGEVVQQVRVNPSVFFFSGAISLLTALIFGFVPALRLSQNKPAAALKDGGRGSNERGRGLRLMIMAQVAIAFVLLIGAAAMSRNLMRLIQADVGYQFANLLKVELGLPPPRYDDPARRVRTIDQVVQRIETLPGVVAAGVTTLQPIPRTTANELTAITLERLVDSSAPLLTINNRIVSPSYFHAMGMHVVRGRGFTAEDTETSAPVLLVNEAAARRFWPGEDPTGHRLKPGRAEDANVPWHTIIGVVNDIAEPDSETHETIYRVYSQAASSQTAGTWRTTSVSLMVRTSGAAPALLNQIREAVRTIDSTLSLHDATSMQSALAEPLSNQRLGTMMFVGFGAFGLFLAALGTYGVIASSVNQRRIEFGIRGALGALPADLLRLVLKEGLQVMLVGLLIGTACALMLSRLLGAVTTEINARDPLTFILTAAVLSLAGVVACWIPARRASRVNPIVALRAE
jgi:putative ABC transport system permease protein